MCSAKETAPAQENWWPIFLIVGYIGLRQEFNRVDKRIDAVIALFKRRGIDIYYL